MEILVLVKIVQIALKHTCCLHYFVEKIEQICSARNKVWSGPWESPVSSIRPHPTLYIIHSKQVQTDMSMACPFQLLPDTLHGFKHRSLHFS